MNFETFFIRVELNKIILSLGLVPLDCNSPFDEVAISRTSIVSPNYPQDYDNNMDCQITVSFALGRKVLIYFETFNFGYSYSSTCYSDYLEVRDGNSSSSDLLGSRLCGTSIPEKKVSTGNSVTIAIHTNYYGAYSGFRLKVLEVGKYYRCNV